MHKWQSHTCRKFNVVGFFCPHAHPYSFHSLHGHPQRQYDTHGDTVTSIYNVQNLHFSFCPLCHSVMDILNVSHETSLIVQPLVISDKSVT